MTYHSDQDTIFSPEEENRMLTYEVGRLKERIEAMSAAAHGASLRREEMRKVIADQERQIDKLQRMVNKMGAEE